MAAQQDIQKYGEAAISGLKGMNWAMRIFLALMVGAGLYVGLPYIASIVENAWQISLGLTKTAILWTAVGATASFLWANRFLFKGMRERWARKLWQRFIYNDPLDYIQTVIDAYEKARKQFQAAINSLRAILNELHTIGQDLVNQYNEGMKNSEGYADSGNKDEAELQAYFALSNMQTAEGVKQSYQELEESILVVQELDQDLGDDIRIMRFDLNMMKMNMRISDAKAAAADALNDAMNGSPTEIAMREFAKEAYRQKVAAGKAKFDAFLQRVSPILESKRIQRSIGTKEGRQALEEFRKNKQTQGGLRSFREQLEELKRQNPNLYKRGGVDLNSLQRRNTETVVRQGFGDRFGSFSALK